MKSADRTWIRAGIARHPVAVAVSLLMSWTLAWVALWIWTFFAGTGVIFATIEAITGRPLGVAGGLLGGLGAGTTAMIAFYLFITGVGALPSSGYGTPLAVAFGALLAFAITVGVMAAEPWVLRLRGYRRLSRREEAVVEPILNDLVRRMNLNYLPLMMMADDGRPAAWTHCRHIVLTTGMVNAGIPDTVGLNRQRLTAVLAHELAHWHAGDGIGATAVWAAALPLMLVYTVAAWLTRGGGRPGIISLLCYIVLWPAFVLTRLVIAPIYAWEGRRQEYEADANAVQLGLGPALAETLSYMQMFEPARTGWAEVLTAEHPPTELRLEALEAQPGRTTRREAPQTPPADPPPDKRSEPRTAEPHRGAVPQRGLRGIQATPRRGVFPDDPPTRPDDIWTPHWRPPTPKPPPDDEEMPY